MSDLSQFYGPNAGYVLELYERFLANPASVDPATRATLEQYGPQLEAALADAPAPAIPATPAAATSAPQPRRDALDTSLDVAHIVGAARLIRYIRELGHLAARIDPLGSEPPGDPGMLPQTHGVTEDDLANLPPSIVRGPLVANSKTALEAYTKLREAYCGAIGYETDQVQSYEERGWIRDAAESQRFFYGFVPEHRKDILQRLTEVECFERFLQQTFVNQKRFSIEGCDMLVPMLDSIIRNAAQEGTQEVVIGMAHRGRLNVLAHTLGKPYNAILSEFQHSTSGEAHGGESDQSVAGRGAIGYTGDVKYHLGARWAYRNSDVKEMPITLVPNPSHLEFVNPVVEGRARAAQEERNQPGAPKQYDHHSLAILIHGDAAFPGQGVVAETLNLSRLPGYRTGGTIHIITNNQIGFTTLPSDSRSTTYASDLAKGFEIPVLHVNADNVEACIAAARMAFAYREKFEKDILIDLVGYRRFGHNEGDEPAYTQPQMYNQISAHPTVRAIYAALLEQEGIIAGGEADTMVRAMMDRLASARQEAIEHPTHDEAPAEPPPGAAKRTVTAIPPATLRELNGALFTLPDGFTPHPKLTKLLEERRNALDQRDPKILWGHAEMLAFASLLHEGIPIRLTGQDSERGTFVQRHLVLHDFANGGRFTALQQLPQARASFAVYNSPLSENAALGYEYGYSAHAPNVLVLWEGQFGDFANGAQVIIDQFIVSGRQKWGHTPALVLLLPHGYEGQGPEHSSARLERFLQLAAGDNIRVANCTTAAQYYHLLRRQALLLGTDPRPLIVMTPKSLLRSPKAASTLDELANGRFERVIDDAAARTRANQVTRLILCSGKVYVDIIAEQEKELAENVAVVRVEELYSFPTDELRAIVSGYPDLHEVVWLQEEPRNMGAWSYMQPRLRELLPPDVPLFYIGRAESSSPAEGHLPEHRATQTRIIRDGLHGTLDAEFAPVLG